MAVLCVFRDRDTNCRTSPFLSVSCWCIPHCHSRLSSLLSSRPFHRSRPNVRRCGPSPTVRGLFHGTPSRGRPPREPSDENIGGNLYCSFPTSMSRGPSPWSFPFPDLRPPSSGRLVRLVTPVCTARPRPPFHGYGMSHDRATETACTRRVETGPQRTVVETRPFVTSSDERGRDRGSGVDPSCLSSGDGRDRFVSTQKEGLFTFSGPTTDRRPGEVPYLLN